MRRALVLPALLLAAAPAGCGDDGVIEGTRTAPPQAVDVVLDLERPPPGPPDAGTQGGHRVPDGVLEVDGPRARFGAVLRPLDARLRADAARGAEVAVTAADGSASVAVRGLRPGANRIELTATAAGLRPWRGEVLILRRPERRSGSAGG